MNNASDNNDHAVRLQEQALRQAYGERILTTLDHYEVEVVFETAPGYRGNGAKFIPRSLRKYIHHSGTYKGTIYSEGRDHFWEGECSKQQLIILLRTLGVGEGDQPQQYNSSIPRSIPGLGEERIPFDVEYNTYDDQFSFGMRITVAPAFSYLSPDVLQQITAPVDEFPNKGKI